MSVFFAFTVAKIWRLASSPKKPSLRACLKSGLRGRCEPSEDLICGGYWRAQRYPTDLTEAEWTILAPLMPAAKHGGRPRTTDIREVINAIFYVLRGGCQWRLLPSDFPPHQTVYHYFWTWRRAGVWERRQDTLRVTCARPRAARVNPVRGSWIARRCRPPKRGIRGDDGGKRIRGRKRHSVVDVLGLLLVVMVHAAGIQDRDGAKPVLRALVARLPGLQLIWADGGTRASSWRGWRQRGGGRW